MSLELNYVFGVPTKVFYNTYMDQMENCKFTRTMAVVENKVGGKFSLYEGHITGYYEKLEDGLILQKWKMKNWETYSDVEIKITEYDEDECNIELKQTNIPNGESIDNIKSGWINKIFKPISLLCGFAIIEDNN